MSILLLCSCSYTETVQEKVKYMILFMSFIKILSDDVHPPSFHNVNFNSSIEACRLLITLGCKFTTMRTDPHYWWISVSSLSFCVASSYLVPLTSSVWIVNWKSQSGNWNCSLSLHPKSRSKVFYMWFWEVWVCVWAKVRAVPTCLGASHWWAANSLISESGNVSPIERYLVIDTSLNAL